VSFVDKDYPVENYRFAVREWHADKPQKILALHGWLDNAASFDELAPHLSDYHLVAVDLPGHGWSDHRPLQGSYNIWDDLVDLIRLIDKLGWQHGHVLGHSRGAMIGFLLAVTQPKRVSSLIGLDALTPLPKPVEEAPKNLRDFVRGYLSLAHKKLPSYASEEAALNARLQASDMSEDAARLLLHRGLRKEGDVYRWTTDARLTLASAVRLTEEHNRHFVEALQVPCKVLLAEQGLIKQFPLLEELQAYPDISFEILPGRHHFHMEEQAAQVAKKIADFLNELGSRPLALS
jgi:pimeloyl-ACP methyl ester carboxylesterase